MSTTENTVEKKNWLEKITDKFDVMMAKYDMPEDIRHDLESFVLSVAKEQYTIGNKSGISWLRKQLGAKPGQLLKAADVVVTAA